MMKTFMLAIKHGDLAAVKNWIANRPYVFSWDNILPSYQRVTIADFINKLSDDESWTPPLILACEFGHVEIVSFLIANGADVNLHAASGKTALTIADENGHAEVVSVLMANGADIEDNSTVIDEDEWSWPENAALEPTYAAELIGEELTVPT